MVFGGAFDPPHLGHEQIVENILESKICDQIWLVPVGIHDFEKNMTPAKHRLAMLQSHLRDQVLLNLCEINRPKVSHTFDTLEELSQQYPDYQFSFLIGSDNLAKFHLWHDYEKMLEKYHFYVYPRAGFPFVPLYPGMIPLGKMPEIKVSSTQIRENLKAGKSVQQLLKKEVAAYIFKYKLYQLA